MEFKPIINFEGYYEISIIGIIRSINRTVTYKNGKKYTYKSKILTQHKDKDGYFKVALNKNNTQKFFFVHRLIAIAFIDNKNDLPQVNHIDGNKQNNDISNLEWVTASENSLHAEKLHLKWNGENHVNSKLTWKDVKEIRNIYNSKTNPSRKLAKIYKVNKSVILDVVNKNTWKWEQENDSI